MKGAITAAAIAGLIVVGCGRKPDKADAAAAPPPSSKPGQVVIAADSPKLKQLRIEQVGTAEVPMKEVVAPGKIEANPSRVAKVVLPLPGKIVNVFVHLGDSVKQGEPLLTLESPDADAAVSTLTQQQAAVAQAQSAVLKAQKDYDRTRDLREHKAIAEKEVLNAESALAQANTGLEQAQASARQARSRLELLGLKPGGFGQQLTVRAPVSGKVLELSVVPGEFRNDTNAQLMTIADLSTVWVASDVPESDIRFIEGGERLDVDLTAYPGEIFRARVMRIADTVDPITRTVKVRAELANPGGRLRPEMFGRVRHVHSVQRLPVVPAGAVVQGDGQNLVYREVSSGVFEQTAVTTGNRVGDLIGIVSGLEPGQRVVTDGVMLLKSL